VPSNHDEIERAIKELREKHSYFSQLREDKSEVKETKAE
jgi:hypothetical protein